MFTDFCSPATLLALVLALACPFVGAEDAPPPKPGDLVFAADFETPESRDGWSKTASAQWVTGYAGSTSLRVSVPADSAEESNMLSLPLDLTRFRGCRLALECLAKAEGVTKPPQPYLGVKFMLHYQSEESGPFWQNQNNVFGAFDWKKLQFLASIAPDATDGSLSLGLQSCSGTAWFDEVKVTVFRGPLPERPAPPAEPGPVFKGHRLPRLRGVMSPHQFREEDLRVLGQEWNANLIRWQICRNWSRVGTDRDLAEYDQWLDGKLTDLDKALDACKRYGLLAVVDMHWPPGGRYESKDSAIFHEAKYQDHWVALWQRIARRYKGNSAVWGYDLVNEPAQNKPSPKGVADYLGAQVRAAKAIRAIDPGVPIIIEANQWDSAAGFRELMPVDVPNVLYQVHLYTPGEFTHQGVHNQKTGIAYPGEIGGKLWNKEALRKALAPVREFQLAYNVHIYCGEFSAVRWAPGAAQYLNDCIELFEEYGWDWTYHAFREWDGWSVEHSADPADHTPTKEPTDRMQVLLKWFAKNEKPR